MMRWLEGFVTARRRRGLRRVAPLAAMLDDVPEWSNDDAEVLAAFMKSPTGARLRARLWDSAVRAAMDALTRPEFERGEARGLERTLRVIEEHAVKRDDE